MGTLNELMNRIVAQLSCILSRTQAYPDDVFVEVLREIAERGGCAGDLEIAFRQAHAAMK